MATIQQKWLKSALNPHFWKVWWKNTNETFLITFEVGQGVSGINPQGFMPRYGNEANFSTFSLLKLLSALFPRIFTQNLVDLFGVSTYYHLTWLKSFISLARTLSTRHLNVTSSSLVLNFCNFSENRSFIQIKVAYKPLNHSLSSWTISSISGRHRPHFHHSFFLQIDVTVLQTQRGFGTFGQKTAPSDSFVQPFLWKIEYLRLYFKLYRITISYKCGTWLIRFVS